MPLGYLQIEQACNLSAVISSIHMMAGVDCCKGQYSGAPRRCLCGTGLTVQVMPCHRAHMRPLVGSLITCML